MHNMTIITSGCTTAYCTEHRGETVICALEQAGELEKYYYPSDVYTIGTVLNFEALAALETYDDTSASGVPYSQ